MKCLSNGRKVFKSRKQIEKFGSLVQEGKMKQDVLDQWMKATPNHKDLPERLTPHKVTRPWKRPKR
jgi:hypothetical protein